MVFPYFIENLPLFSSILLIVAFDPDSFPFIISPTVNSYEPLTLIDVISYFNIDKSTSTPLTINFSPSKNGVAFEITLNDG